MENKEPGLENKEPGTFRKALNSVGKRLGSVGSAVRNVISATNNKTNNNESKSANNNIEIDEVNHDIYFVNPKNNERLYEVKVMKYHNALLEDYQKMKNDFIEEKKIFEERSKVINEKNITKESSLNSGAGGFSDKDRYRIKGNLLINSDNPNKTVIYYSDNVVNGKKQGKYFDVSILDQKYKDKQNETSYYFKLVNNRLYYVNNDSSPSELVDEVKDFHLEIRSQMNEEVEGGSKSAQNKLVKNHRKNTQNRRLKKRRYTNKRSNRRKY